MTGSADLPVGEAPARPRRIATEESFAIPEIAAATRRFMAAGGATTEPGFAALVAGFGAEQGRRWMGEALDFGAARTAAMDAAGIDTQILLLSAPGVQIFDPAEAGELAQLANDTVARVQRADPWRYAGLATVAPQDPTGAAAELERAVRDLGLKGALINSHTRGQYLDDRRFWPVFEVAQALDVPVYLHPREPSPDMLTPFLDHALHGPIWGFAAETGLHALRLIMAGVFDEFPQLRVILGHLGEGLPFFIDRIDIRYAVDGSPLRRKLQLRPSEYLRRNFLLTTSGMNWEPSVRQALSVVGPESVMFAADWPYEDALAASRAFDRIALTDQERERLLHANAERVFRL